jgi:hypothetical protein
VFFPEPENCSLLIEKNDRVMECVLISTKYLSSLHSGNIEDLLSLAKMYVSLSHKRKGGSVGRKYMWTEGLFRSSGLSHRDNKSSIFPLCRELRYFVEIRTHSITLSFFSISNVLTSVKICFSATSCCGTLMCQKIYNLTLLILIKFLG